MRLTQANLALVLLSGAFTAASQTSVLTYHNDNARTGRYSSEILLTPTNVKAGLFGKRHFLPTDGGVYGQPLYLSRVNIAAKGLRNVLFVATAHDSLYAFDADDESTTQPLWQVSFLDPGQGVTSVSAADVNCAVIPELGVLGTPVVDPVAGTIYLIAVTKEPASAFVFRLHALDVTSGAERAGSPVVIQPPGFVPLSHKQRTALLLSNGVVYSSWSGHCDNGTYHGWVMAHDATTLKLLGTFNTSPTDSGASFWNGGAGPAADDSGNVYVVSANGDFDGDLEAATYDESVLKLAPAPGLALDSLFTPYNKPELDQQDLDLGSSGALLLPDEAGSTAHPHLLVTAGKEGRMYLLDRENLGGLQAGSDFSAITSVMVSSTSTFGLTAYFNGSVYIAPEKSPMFAFRVSGGTLSTTPSERSSNTNGPLGATPVVSADGVQNGVVWVTTEDGDGRLIAYDAGQLTLLYDSNAKSTDYLGGYTEFSVPTVVDGRVFAGNYYGVAVYGELLPSPPSTSAAVNAASYVADALSPGSLFSIFGSGLAAATASAPSIPLPLSLADTSVTINGVVAPLLYVSPKQINAQIPSEIPTGPAVALVRTQGVVSQSLNITIQPAAPGVFTSGQGQAAALNADGSINSQQHPALAGSIVSVFFTGQGPVAAAPQDGAAPDAGQVISAISRVTATIGDVAADVQFAGLAPLYAGLAQMNLKVPALAAGVYPLVITIGENSSNAAQLVVSAP